jgi:hypothetical protein
MRQCDRSANFIKAINNSAVVRLTTFASVRASPVIRTLNLLDSQTNGLLKRSPSGKS